MNLNTVRPEQGTEPVDQAQDRLVEVPVSKGYRASPSTGSGQGFDKLSPNGFARRILSLLANQDGW